MSHEQIIISADDQAAFEAARIHVDEIGQQNALLADVDENVHHAEFKEPVRAHLTAQQSNSFAALTNIALPYNELVAREADVRKRFVSVEAKIAAIGQAGIRGSEEVDEEKAFIVTRLPGLSEELEGIAEHLHSSVEQEVAKVLGQLSTERAALESELSEISAVLYGEEAAWPIPQLLDLRPQETAAPEDSTQEDVGECIEVDEFPALTTHSERAELAERVRKEYAGRLDGASEFIALLLAEKPGEIYTLVDLASLVYREDEPNARARVSALISNFKLQKTPIIGITLLEQGLMFQQGVRQQYDIQSKRPVGQKHAVFRAVALDGTAEERVIHANPDDKEYAWLDDGWHTLVYATDPRNTPRSSEAIDTAQPDTTEATSREEQLISPLETLPEAPKETPEMPQITQETRPTRTRKAPEWHAEFKASVAKAIEQLESDELMMQEKIPMKLVLRKASSKSLGTETMAQRGHEKSKILTRAETNQDASISIIKLIALTIQNTHQQIFSSRTQRRQALVLIEQAVDAYFRQHS